MSSTTHYRIGSYLVALTAACLVSSARVVAAAPASPPNFVIIFADDLGYGDLSCSGHPTIRTPHLDRMAAEGIRLTQFYSAAPVCTPSRAGLMTGRYPIRSGMCGTKHGVLFPRSLGGIQDDEILLSEALKARGYATACVGKWHLGHLPQYLPTRHGFDSYLGIPYSNDMVPTPLMRDEAVIEEPADQTTLTRRYTEEAVRFIKANRDRPFLLYFAHTFPHVPLFASDKFKDTSARGLYGDVVEELDWSVGQVLDTLRGLGLAKRTLVWFTSDNGPWLVQKLNGGSAGLLRDGKGGTWEGGMREPGIAWWPGTIEAGRITHAITGTLDIFPTCVALAGGQIPTDRTIDGLDITGVLTGKSDHAHDTWFYYRRSELRAIRFGPWKAHWVTQRGYHNDRQEHDPPALYQLEHDPGEQWDVSAEHPDIIAKFEQIRAEHVRGVRPVPSQLEKMRPKRQQEKK
jgi:arylsulfatase A